MNVFMYVYLSCKDGMYMIQVEQVKWVSVNLQNGEIERKILVV